MTMEKWVCFDGSHAWASVSVTGRSVDEEGLRDLLNRTIDSMRPIEARRSERARPALGRGSS